MPDGFDFVQHPAAELLPDDVAAARRPAPAGTKSIGSPSLMIFPAQVRAATDADTQVTDDATRSAPTLRGAPRVSCAACGVLPVVFLPGAPFRLAH